MGRWLAVGAAASQVPPLLPSSVSPILTALMAQYGMSPSRPSMIIPAFPLLCAGEAKLCRESLEPQLPGKPMMASARDGGQRMNPCLYARTLAGSLYSPIAYLCCTALPNSILPETLGSNASWGPSRSSLLQLPDNFPYSGYFRFAG